MRTTASGKRLVFVALVTISGAALADSAQAKQMFLSSSSEFTAQSQETEPGFSREFMRAGIQATSAIKEWRSRLAYGVQRAYPGDGSGLIPYRDRSVDAVRLATAAASTDSDRSGVQLLTNHFKNVDQWAAKMLAARKSMDATASMSPNALDDDPLFVTIKRCADFLAPMLASGKFADDGSCH